MKKQNIFSSLVVGLVALSIITPAVVNADPSATPPGGNVDAHFNSVGTSTIYNGTDSATITGDVLINGNLNVSDTGVLTNPRFIDFSGPPYGPDILYDAGDEADCVSRGGTVLPIEGSEKLCIYPVNFGDQEGLALGTGLVLLPPGLFGAGSTLYNTTTDPISIGPVGVDLSGDLTIDSGVIKTNDNLLKLEANSYIQLGDSFLVDWNGYISNPQTGGGMYDGLLFSDNDGVVMDSPIQFWDTFNISRTISTADVANFNSTMYINTSATVNNQTAVKISDQSNETSTGLFVESDGTAVSIESPNGGSHPNAVAINVESNVGDFQIGSKDAVIDAAGVGASSPIVLSDGFQLTGGGTISNPGTTTDVFENYGIVTLADAQGVQIGNGTDKLFIDSAGRLSNPNAAATAGLKFKDDQGFEFQNTAGTAQLNIAGTTGDISDPNAEVTINDSLNVNSYTSLYGGLNIYSGAVKNGVMDVSGNFRTKGVVTAGDVDLLLGTSAPVTLDSSGIDVTGQISNSSSTHSGDVYVNDDVTSTGAVTGATVGRFYSAGWSSAVSAPAGGAGTVSKSCNAGDYVTGCDFWLWKAHLETPRWVQMSDTMTCEMVFDNTDTVAQNGWVRPRCFSPDG